MLLLALSRFRQALFLSLVTLILIGCGPGGGGGDGSGTDPGDVAPDVLRIGSGSGANFVGGQINASQTNLAAGESTTIQVNVVNQDGNPPSGGATVTLSSICVSSGLANFNNQVELTTGLTQVTYTSAGCSGNDTITATLVETGGTATVTIDVTAPEVLAVSFVSSSVPQLSLAGIGGNETTELTFSVTGPQAVPIIGDTVNFSISTSAGGASILAGRETGITDANGLVRTILKSGTFHSTVNVLASHSATSIQGISDDIIISTGIPEAKRFSLSYENFNPADAFNTNGITVSISIIASDQFGNNTHDGTRVSFSAPEGGNVEDSCEIIDGACTVIWRSSDPRPADGRIQVIAYTTGTESFTDNNGNSVFDGFDNGLIDLGEPFADENENGTYELGEFFFDTDEDGVRDSGNGLWDGPCLDLVEPIAICTGQSSTTISRSATIVLSTNIPRFVSMGTFQAFNSTITIQQGTSISFAGLIIADNNTNAAALGGNPLPFGTTITFAIDGNGAAIQGLDTSTIVNTTGPTGPYGTTVVVEAIDPLDPLPTSARLLMTIATPSGTPSQYSWPITVTR